MTPLPDAPFLAEKRGDGGRQNLFDSGCRLGLDGFEFLECTDGWCGVDGLHGGSGEDGCQGGCQ